MICPIWNGTGWAGTNKKHRRDLDPCRSFPCGAARGRTTLAICAVRAQLAASNAMQPGEPFPRKKKGRHPPLRGTGGIVSKPALPGNARHGGADHANSETRVFSTPHGHRSRRRFRGHFFCGLFAPLRALGYFRGISNRPLPSGSVVAHRSVVIRRRTASAMDAGGPTVFPDGAWALPEELFFFWPVRARISANYVHAGPARPVVIRFLVILTGETFGLPGRPRAARTPRPRIRAVVTG